MFLSLILHGVETRELDDGRDGQSTIEIIFRQLNIVILMASTADINE